MSRYVQVIKNGSNSSILHVKVNKCTTSRIIQQYRNNHTTGQLFNGFTTRSQTYLPSTVGIRYASTEAPVPPAAASVVDTTSLLDKIPEPPPIPIPELLEKVVALGEPTFASIGLGGWTPVGLVQNCMEFLHIGCDIPWYFAITIGTIVVRCALFPLVIMSQRNGAKMNNYLPELQVLQMKMSEARQTGNQIEAARYSQEMILFMKDKNLNPMKNLLVPFAQAPVFISFFMGLRGMANTPVGSLRDGGLFWFSDLTVPDPYYILPVITSITMWLTIEIGTDSAKLSAQNMQIMKYVLRALPVVIFPFTVSFPGAILWYWTCTNFISLLQVGFLKLPKVRQYFKIDAMVTHKPETLPMKPKGFVNGIKDTWTNMKITRELEDRQRADEMRFKRAGRAVIQKTYKYDPTKAKPLEKPIAGTTTSYSTKP